jgi:hypothetical protein
VPASELRRGDDDTFVICTGEPDLQAVSIAQPHGSGAFS